MKTTIDSAGRLVLPKPAREALHLEGEAQLDVRIVGDHVELEPIPLEVEIVKKDTFHIAVPITSVQKTLTVDDVEKVRGAIQEDRESSQR